MSEEKRSDMSDEQGAQLPGQVGSFVLDWQVEEGPYDDIIDLPHHVSSKHPPMPLEDRAAQFSPFAALTGYEDSIDEAGRLVDGFIAMDDETSARLDRTYAKLKEELAGAKLPFVRVTYFVPDERKEGGTYAEHEGHLRRVDEHPPALVFSDGTRIELDRVVDIGE